jgi:hypothetical protein
MRENPLREPLAALSQIFNGFVGALEQERRDALRRSAAGRRQEAALLRNEAERLAKQLGADHPAVLEIAAAAEDARLLAAHDRVALERAEKWPRVDQDGWMVAGQVRWSSGEPAAGVEVRFVDPTGKLTQVLGSAKTDQAGDFFRLYSPIQDRDVLELRPEVFAEVVGERGQAQVRSDEGATVQPGGAAYFDLELPGEAPSPAPTPSPTRPPAPTPAPTPTPTPTPRPTQPPGLSPTQPPTPAPTPTPTPRPTPAPTQPPTPAPTPRPTAPPTQPPALRPTPAPTPPPTQPPTQRPTPAPTPPPTGGRPPTARSSRPRSGRPRK